MSTYKATITQEGELAPVANVKMNDTGMTVTWTRENVGRYAATFSEDITAAMVEIVCQSVYCEDPTNYFNTLTAFAPSDGSNRILVVTSQFNVDSAWEGGSLKDGLLKNWSIEVRL